MERLIRFGTTILKARIIRVLFFGGIGFILQTIVFELLSIYFQVLPPSSGSLLGAEVGVITSFLLNNRYSFRDRTHAPLSRRLLRYHIVVSGSLFIQWFALFITEKFTTDFLIIHSAYVAGVVVGFICNYIGYHLWVWRHHANPEEIEL